MTNKIIIIFVPPEKFLVSSIGLAESTGIISAQFSDTYMGVFHTSQVDTHVIAWFECDIWQKYYSWYFKMSIISLIFWLMKLWRKTLKYTTCGIYAKYHCKSIPLSIGLQINGNNNNNKD